MVIGVLALQGAVAEHIRILELCGAEVIPIKKPEEIDRIQALVIPGGESTTIGKLMVKYSFAKKIKDAHKQGMPIFGTCAGLVLVAKQLTEGKQPLLGLIDIKVKRNAFGRQRESFEADLGIPELGTDSFPCVFIRSPWIEYTGPKVKVMSRFNNKVVMAREGNVLVSAFHPELTEDLRIHRYFVDMVKKSRNSSEKRIGRKE